MSKRQPRELLVHCWWWRVGIRHGRRGSRRERVGLDSSHLFFFFLVVASLFLHTWRNSSGILSATLFLFFFYLFTNSLFPELVVAGAHDHRSVICLNRRAPSLFIHHLVPLLLLLPLPPPSYNAAIVFNPHLAPSFWSLSGALSERAGERERRSFSVTAGGFKLGCCFSCCCWSNGFFLSSLLLPASAIFFLSKEAPKSGEREKEEEEWSWERVGGERERSFEALSFSYSHFYR